MNVDERIELVNILTKIEAIEYFDLSQKARLASNLIQANPNFRSEVEYSLEGNLKKLVSSLLAHVMRSDEFTIDELLFARDVK